jgi:hypothetical protein
MVENPFMRKITTKHEKQKARLTPRSDTSVNQGVAEQISSAKADMDRWKVV